MNIEQSLLLTDLYELSMLEAYAAYGMTEIAVFELFVRKLPPERGFLVAAGLEQLIDFLEQLHFTPEELAWLGESGRFNEEFIAGLAGFRFTGDLDALSEGTVFFVDEPIVRVIAPLPEAQLVETRLINLIHFQTVIASKAARMVLAAPDKQLIDFGLRRAHGSEAGLLAARASYLTGFAGTATLVAERDFGIPAFGTMAHSFIQANDDEATAFERFARVRPRNLTLLIDTYGNGRLLPPANTPERLRYVYWLHYAEGSAMPPLLLKLLFTLMPKRAPALVRPLVRKVCSQALTALVNPQLKLHMAFWESELSKSEWFAGDDFTAADIQMSFPLEAAAARGGLEQGHPKAMAFLERIHARPAYQRALERGGPYAVGR